MLQDTTEEDPPAGSSRSLRIRPTKDKPDGESASQPGSPQHPLESDTDAAGVGTEEEAPAKSAKTSGSPKPPRKDTKRAEMEHPWPNRSLPKKPLYSYRCPYCVKAQYSEPHLVYDHVGVAHDEILMEEVGAEPDDKWSQLFNRVENLARKGLRYVHTQRVTQHFEGVKDFLRECNRPDIIGMLDRAIKFAFAEAMVQLSNQEIYLPERTTPIVKSMLAELRSAPAYSNAGKLALFNPLRQA